MSSLTHLLTHLLTYSPTDSPTHLLIHLLTYSLTFSLTHSLLKVTSEFHSLIKDKRFQFSKEFDINASQRAGCTDLLPCFALPSYLCRQYCGSCGNPAEGSHPARNQPVKTCCDHVLPDRIIPKRTLIRRIQYIILTLGTHSLTYLLTHLTTYSLTRCVGSYQRGCTHAATRVPLHSS